MTRPILFLTALGLVLVATACDRGPAPASDDAGAAGAPAAAATTPSAPAQPRPWSPPRWRTRVQRSVAGKPEHILACDLDGDGRAELIATTRDPGALHVWSGAATGDGVPAGEPTVHPSGGWQLGPVAMPAGSFGASADTRLVAVASRADRTVVLHDLVGGAEPREVWRGATPLDVPRTLAVGDLGADGTVELAVATDSRELHLVSDSSVEVRALTGELPRCMLFLDDGAGVAVGFQDTQAVEVHGPGAAEGPLDTLQLDGIPRDLIEADVDFDGELELVVVGGTRTLWAFGRGRSGGSAAWLAEPDREPYPWDTYTVPIDVEAPDIRGDGRSELCILHAYDLSYVISGGWGDGRPEEFERGYAGQTPTDCTLADLDGDGRLDLAIANRDARAISILLGNGRGRMHDAAHTDVGTAPSFVIAVDLTDDELPEVVTLDSKSESVTILANRRGALEPALRMDESGPSPRGLVAAQLDGSGALELAWLVTDNEGARIAFAEIDGDGVLTPVAEPVPIGTSGTDLLALDVDGDGRSELVCADADAGEVVLVTWAPDAPWPAANLHRLAVPSAPRALTALEFDGDDGPEIAVALGSPGPRRGVALLDVRQDEAGALSLVETDFVATEAWPIDLVAANLDGIGASDLAVLALVAEGSADGVLLTFAGMAGPEPFTARAPALTGLRPHHVVAADLDGDGLDDVCVNSQNSHVVNAWLSLPESPHLERLDDLGAHLGPLDLAATDLDGDGLVDIVVANSFSNDVSALFGEPR